MTELDPVRARNRQAALERLHGKFVVHRTDPAAEARHQGCEHFVLDVTHDPAARIAVEAYADAVGPSNPRLAADIYHLVDITEDRARARAACGATVTVGEDVLTCTLPAHVDRWHRDNDRDNEWGGPHNGPAGCARAGMPGHRECTQPAKEDSR